MSRLRQPGDSHYDVLGVSPDASAEEIDGVFRKLIDGAGYKEDIPLNRQWLRARQIKDAHATVGDAAKRRAYDASLSGTSEPAPWAMTANDPATDELVLPEIAPDASNPIEYESPSDTGAPPDLDPTAMAGSTPNRSPDGFAEPEAELAAEVVQDEPAPEYPATAAGDDAPEPAPTIYDDELVSKRRWVAAAAAASGLGLVLVSSWLVWNGQPSASERAPIFAADAGQSSGAGTGLRVDGAPASKSGEGEMSRGDSPAASDASGPDTGEPVTSHAASARPSATAMPAGPTPVAAIVSSAPVEAAEVRATATTPTPPVVETRAIATAPVVAESPGNPIRSPPQWVGGGPTDADNRRGRHQGEVTVQVAVEPSGRVSNCAPVLGSGNAGLDAMTCRLIRERAQFSPALDGRGRPVASQAYTTIVWGRRRRR